MKLSLQDKKSTMSQQSLEVIPDAHIGIYGEEQFIEMLAYEQQRSEHSGKPFLLMTLSVLGSSTLDGGHAILKQAADACSAFSRDTDIKGWFRYPSTLGVIFSHMEESDLVTLRETIDKRILTQLKDVQEDTFDVSFYNYPDDKGSPIPVGPEGFTFYPDRND
jgi:hypothetical protein